MMGSVGANSPSRMCRSVPQMPHAATSTTTSRGPGLGSSSVTSSSWSTALITAARMTTSPLASLLGDLLLTRAHGPAAYQLVLRRTPRDEHRKARDGRG